MCRPYLSRLAIGIALASFTNAHPAFRGRILSRDTDLLPSYDYVVVGGGASGLTVANRLTEDSSKLHCLNGTWHLGNRKS